MILPITAEQAEILEWAREHRAELRKEYEERGPVGAALLVAEKFNGSLLVPATGGNIYVEFPGWPQEYDVYVPAGHTCLWAGVPCFRGSFEERAAARSVDF